MRVCKALLMVVCLAALWSLTPTCADADTIYDGGGFFVGTQSLTDAFTLSSAGTLTVTLTNVALPTLLANLSLTMSTASGALGPQMGAGTETFNVQAGDYFANWFGTGQGPLKAGAYGLDIQFQPTGAVVPLPASIVLLLSGLGLLLWQRRMQPDQTAKLLPTIA